MNRRLSQVEVGTARARCKTKRIYYFFLCSRHRPFPPFVHAVHHFLLVHAPYAIQTPSQTPSCPIFSPLSWRHSPSYRNKHEERGIYPIGMGEKNIHTV